MKKIRKDRKEQDLREARLSARRALVKAVVTSGNSAKWILDMLGQIDECFKEAGI